MGVLEQVMDLKRKGYEDSDIINTLKDQGASPKSINDALSQARIKTAVSPDSDFQNQNPNEMEPSIMRPERAEFLPIDRSIPDEDLEPPTPSKFQAPKGSAIRDFSDQNQEYKPSPQMNYSQYSPYQYSNQGQSQQGWPEEQQEYYQPSGYYDEYASQGATGTSDTDTIIEISEQVFSEKVKEIRKSLDTINDFKALTETKVENMSDRLRRIESVMDKLQSAILDKIGEYGSGLESVKKEMSMMQESFGKIVNTVANSAEHKHTQGHSTISKPTVHRIEKKTTVTHHSKPTKRKSRR